jgi:hypothetical protein
MNAVVRAVQPRHASVHDRVELAGVEMTPAAILVVVDRRGGTAHGAHPPRVRRKRHRHVHLAGIQLRLHTLDVPRGLEPQHRRRQVVDLAHARPLREGSALMLSGRYAAGAAVFTHTKAGRARKLASPTPNSWNQIAVWLSEMAALKSALGRRIA